jgi:hypothetical protein
MSEPTKSTFGVTMPRWIRLNEGFIVLLALAVAFVSCTVITTRLDHKRQTYFSDIPLTRQISYCFFKGLYHPKDPRHRKELWAKDGYLPCYFIPHKENI